MPDQVLTNTYLPAGPGGTTLEHRSLRDMVEMVAIDDTPLYSNMTKVRAEAIKEEWGTEDLGTIVAAPARNRGFVAAPQAPIGNRLLDNILELNAVEFGVSDSMNALRAAGNTNTFNHQRLKWGMKLRRNINKLLHTPQAKAAAEPTQMATLPAYITNFFSVATTPGVAPAGNGTNIPTAGTGPQPLNTIVHIDNIMEASVVTRGTPKVIYMHPKRKKEFSRIPDASVAENRIMQTAGRNPDPFVFVGTVDLYLSDFGLLEIIVDIDAPTSALLFVDHDYCDMPVLPGMDFDEKMLGRRGSGEEMLIQHEATIRVLLPEAFGYINDYN